MSDIAVSVVIGTYNRCELLSRAIAGVLNQSADGIPYELLVVDNNSTDRTRNVVEAFIEGGRTNLRYVFESKQGVSHARNAGVAAARGSIVAFTDDDVRVGPDWIANIKRAFDEHSDADIVGGKVLPNWNELPPSWLTDDHWAPLALVNYGDHTFYSNSEKQRCMLTANMSIRRKVFEEVGGFSPACQRVKDGIGSTEDHEFQLRFWNAGKQALYAPDVVVTADIQSDRLEKAYHRRWHKGHGGFCAMMRLLDVPAPRVTLFGSPAYLYSSIPKLCARWLFAAIKRQESQAFSREVELRFALSYIKKAYELDHAKFAGAIPEELARFTQELLRNKFSPAARMVKRGPPAKTQSLTRTGATSDENTCG